MGASFAADWLPALQALLVVLVCLLVAWFARWWVGGDQDDRWPW